MAAEIEIGGNRLVDTLSGEIPIYGIPEPRVNFHLGEEFSLELHELLARGEITEAARRIVGRHPELSREGFVVDEVNRIEIIRTWFHALLNNDRYVDAAWMSWGKGVFDPTPREVKLVWNSLFNNYFTLVMGAGAVGKTYSAGVWMLLDWCRDPLYTTAKILSVTKVHSQQNLMSHLIQLHGTSAVPLPGYCSQGYIGLDEKEKKSGISYLAIPQGDNKSGRLRGFHPMRRPKRHARFGLSTRIRVVLDEAEEIPENVWQDVGNILLSKEGKHIVKIFGATNPKDKTSKFASYCEPNGGWKNLDYDADTWASMRGASVVRLDAAKSANVVMKKKIYEGFQTYEGYLQLIQTFGEDSPSYWTMCRGLYPPEGTIETIVSETVLKNIRGKYIFQGTPRKAAAVDLAFGGKDRAEMTIGQFGRATGILRGGAVENFKNPKFAVQLDLQIRLTKSSDTIVIAQEIMSICKNAGIEALFLAVDATAIGQGVYDYLRAYFPGGGGNILKVDYATSATETKVFEEDSALCSDLYDGIVTELWFAARRWFEFEVIAFNPDLNSVTMELEKELTRRKYIQGRQKKARVESKLDYKARGNPSPDLADSFTMFLQVIRVNGGILPSMKREEEREPNKRGVTVVEMRDEDISETAKLHFMGLDDEKSSETLDRRSPFNSRTHPVGFGEEISGDSVDDNGIW